MNEITEVTHSLTSFWPEQYGHWMGTIVHAFRQAAGF